MKKTALMVCVVFVSAVFLVGCASQYKQAERDVRKPVRCDTAEGDIRSLQHEKAHVGEQIAMGAASITPIGLVAGVATGTEKTKLKVTTGEYDKMIDDKIAQIKRVCGIN